MKALLQKSRVEFRIGRGEIGEIQIDMVLSDAHGNNFNGTIPSAYGGRFWLRLYQDPSLSFDALYRLTQFHISSNNFLIG